MLNCCVQGQNKKKMLHPWLSEGQTGSKRSFAPKKPVEKEQRYELKRWILFTFNEELVNRMKVRLVTWLGANAIILDVYIFIVSIYYIVYSIDHYICKSILT